MQITGWGRYPRVKTEGIYFEDSQKLGEYLKKESDVIIYGLGRSYGDSALNQKVIFSRRFNNILDFDPQNGVVTCESGVSLAEVIQVFSPKGWFLAITPGTRFITVGGAIASDVHGKNHHQEGCFSQCLLYFDLMLADKKIVRCSRKKNTELFFATCGGMGLTGVILSAAFRMQRIPSTYIKETTFRAKNLEETFMLFEEQQKVPYSVAWIDCLGNGNNLGRAHLMVGDFIDNRGFDPPPAINFSTPMEMPEFLLNRFTGRLFNQLYYQRISKPTSERVVHLADFFYPLDAILHWNRLYGRRGFTQYQLVLPKEASLPGLRLILSCVSQSGLGAFLGTIKLFGPQNRNYLSFPMEGYTLAMDFKIQQGLFHFLDELDRIVLDHGGRLYLTKDVRMSPETFRKGYPHWKTFLDLRERLGLREKYNSLQSKRLGI